MSRVAFIDEKTVERHITPQKALDLSLEAFHLIASGDARMPAKVYLDLPGGNDFRAMPAYFQRRKGRGEGACGLKWISVYPQNRRFGLPTVNGTLFLNSLRTGELLAVVEANTLTALRTAGAAAVAARHLCRPRPKRLAIVGAGIQAGFQLRAMASLYDFESIRVWGYLPGEAERFCGAHRARFAGLRASADVRDCVDGADLIVTCTSSRRPLVSKRWVKRGAHINAIGADAKGKQELDPALVHSAKVVVDEWGQASHSGEINVPFSRGLFLKKNLHAELSQIVSGKKPGRTGADEITIFDSTGVGVLDVVFARYVYDATRKA